MDLEKFLNKEITRPTYGDIHEGFSDDREILNEGVADFLKGIADKFQKAFSPILNSLKSVASKFVRSVKSVFLKEVRGKAGQRVYPVYEESASGGKTFGYMYPDHLLTAAGKKLNGSKRATFLKVYYPNKLRGNAIKVAIDPQFMTNASRSNNALKSSKSQPVADIPESRRPALLGKLSEELLGEVRVNRNMIKSVSSGGQKEKAFSKKMDATYNSLDVGIPDPQTFIEDESFSEYISSAKIEIENLADILSEFLYTLSWRKSYKQPVPSLLMLGFPGGGKTSLINSFGRGRFQVHVLEIASIYKEVLGGFPVVEDIYKDPETLRKFDDHVSKLRGKDTLEGEVEETDEDGQVRTKAVSMKAADLFPQEDGRIHIFFLDEYNRDAEKMAASMNLMLSGSIGTQYHLPKKTIVIASGNLGENIDRVKVAKLDSATFDRYDARVLLSRNVQRSLEYSRASTTYGGEEGIDRDLPDELRLDKIETVDADKIDEYKIDMGGLVSSIDIFFNDMIEKYGPELMGKGWEKDLSIKPLESEYQTDTDFDDEEMIYQITPRTVDKINTRLKNRAMRDWIEAKEGKGDLADPKDIEKYFLKNETTSRYMNNKTPEDWEETWEKHKDEYLGRGIPSPTALYLHIMQWHDAYLPTVLKQIAGGNPREIIKKVRNSAYQAVKDANKVSINDIVFGYVPKKLFGHEITMKDGSGNDKKKLLNKEDFMSLVQSMNTIKDQVMRNLVDVISKNSSDTAMKNIIKTVSGKSYEEVEKAVNEVGVQLPDGPRDLVAVNIAVFMKDMQLTEARAASFIRRLKEFGVTVNNETGETEAGEADPGVEAKKKAQEVVSHVYSALWQMSDVIKNTRFIQSGGAVDDIEESLFRKKTNKKSDYVELEEGMRSVFKRLQ